MRKGKLNLLVLMLLAFGSTAQRRLPTREETALRKQKQQAVREKDSINRAQVKAWRLPIILKFQLANGFAVMDQNQSPFKVYSSVGSGGELQLGFKAANDVSMGIGVNVMNFLVDNTTLQQSVKQWLAKDDYTSTVVSYQKTSVTKTGLFFYTSYWHYRAKSVMEFYTKLSFTFSEYRMDYIAFSRENNTHFSEYDLVNKHSTFQGLMPSMGVNYARKLSSACYLTLAGEYGYNITQATTLTQVNKNSDGGGYQKELPLPVPVHFIQLNIGVMLRPFNKLHPGESRYDDEILNRINGKNN